MAETPQFNVKIGSDSSLYYSREETNPQSENNGKVLETATNGSDVMEYPVLSRRTGHSIKGTTETIESNEIRKGRCKSAPRKGNSSSEGDLEFEFSSQTYDDFLEATFRGEWQEWTSDTDSPSNIVAAGEEKPECANNQFLTQMGDPLYESESTTGERIKNPKRYLLGNKGDVAPDGKSYVVEVDDKDAFEVHELCTGTKDIKYDILTQYGGVEGEDLYQDFEHMAVNAMSLSVSPGEIVTGSFSFMGANNPELLGKGAVYAVADPQPTSSTFSEGTYYTLSNGVYTLADSWASGVTYYVVNPTETIKQFTTRFARPKTAQAIDEWIDKLPEKATDTDQFTAREGFLYVCGERVQYGSNLTFNLDNGLKKLFAIFEKGSISTQPLALDITGDFSAYLIKGYSEKLFNLCTKDEDVEMLYCFQDKEENPDSLYIFQIFKTKFTGNEIGTGTEELDISLPYSSFGERACRIFRIRRRKILKTTLEFDSSTGLPKNVSVMVSSVKSGFVPATDLTVTATVDRDDATASVVTGTMAATAENKVYECSLTSPEKGDAPKKLVVKVSYNGMSQEAKFTIPAA